MRYLTALVLSGLVASNALAATVSGQKGPTIRRNMCEPNFDGIEPHKGKVYGYSANKVVASCSGGGAYVETGDTSTYKEFLIDLTLRMGMSPPFSDGYLKSIFGRSKKEGVITVVQREPKWIAVGPDEVQLTSLALEIGGAEAQEAAAKVVSETNAKAAASWQPTPETPIIRAQLPDEPAIIAKAALVRKELTRLAKGEIAEGFPFIMGILGEKFPDDKDSIREALVTTKPGSRIAIMASYIAELKVRNSEDMGVMEIYLKVIGFTAKYPYNGARHAQAKVSGVAMETVEPSSVKNGCPAGAVPLRDDKGKIVYSNGKPVNIYTNGSGMPVACM